MKINKSNNYEVVALDNLISKLSQKYDSLFFTQINKQLYIYRVINRKEYKNIIKSDISDLEKQDQICSTCVLYPENFNVNECDCGIPQHLYKEITEKSCLSLEDMIILLEMNREEMELLDNQMTCVISQAFPAYKIEDIENMNMIDFIKLFTRAEWVLNNFKDFELNEDVVDLLRNALNEDNKDEDNKDEDDNRNNTSHRAKMSPEQMKQYKEFCKKFPDFNMASDYAFTGDVGPGFNKDAPALRPGWGIPKKKIK